jgi:hypothetical protein
VSSSHSKPRENDAHTSCSDDLTVEVIFFGDGEATGTVTLNKEASAVAPEDVLPKPKL